MSHRFKRKRIHTVGVKMTLPPEDPTGEWTVVEFDLTMEAGKRSYFKGVGGDQIPDDRIEQLAVDVGKHVRGWTMLDEDGGPFECTEENIKDTLDDYPYLLAFIRTWMAISIGQSIKN